MKSLKPKHDHRNTCQLTGAQLPAEELVPVNAISDGILKLIRKDNPALKEHGYIAARELHKYRMRFVKETLESEKGELSKLDQQVLESLNRNELLSRTLQMDMPGKLTLGQRMADRIASFGGSWRFILLFFIFLVGWMALNSILLRMSPFDPYPFILLNLILSCLAAIQAPIIMMSQNRLEEKDRERGKYDYQVDLKAELEIRLLNEKVDHLLMRQGQRMLEMQQIQLELIEELVARSRK